uniref:Flagellar basal body P-ring formation protein FlgA n=1 Tax=Desulfobacca acetoxidans TaxID=60893 RepID=A0A7C3WRR4_9BACT
MLQSFWLLLVSFCLTGPAANAAEPGITFRPEAAAVGEYILLKDLAEFPPDMPQTCGQLQIWAAPPPGQVYPLTKEFLHYRLSQLGMGGLLAEATVPPVIQVRQTGTFLPKEQVEAAFRRYVLTHTPFPANQVRIEVLPLEEPVLVPDKEVTLEVLPPKTGRLVGEVSLEMALIRQGHLCRRLRVNGKVSLEREVVCSVKPLLPQTVIGPGDVRLCRRDVTNLGAEDFFVSMEQVMGRVLSRALGAQEILSPRHLSHQPVIQRGEEVTVILDDHGLIITTRGVAREPGYPGRPIRMLNPKSKKEFQAQVVDAKTVKVTW